MSDRFQGSGGDSPFSGAGGDDLLGGLGGGALSADTLSALTGGPLANLLDEALRDAWAPGEDLFPPDRRLRATKWIWCLSGGGAQGAFQVGAIQYLKDRESLYPAAVVGTSVGSLNALKAAEASYAAFDQLKRTWLTLLGPGDMWDYAPLIHLAHDGSALEGLRQLGIIDFSVKSFIDGFSGVERAWPGPNDPSPLPIVGSSPVGDFVLGLFDALHEVATLPETAMSALPPILKIGFGADDLVDRILGTKAMLTLSPTETLLRRNLDLAAVVNARSPAGEPIPLRLVSVALDDGQLRVVTERNTIVRAVPRGPWGLGGVRDEKPLEGSLEANLVAGALASAAIPATFEPVVLTDIEGTAVTCVDGGARDVLPVSEAIHLQQNEITSDDVSDVGIIAIFAGPSGSTHASEPFDGEMLDIAFQGLDILQNDVRQGDRRQLQAHAEHFGVRTVLIEPAVKAGGLATIDVGRTQIQLAYGWMMAHDHIRRALGEIDHQEFVRLQASTHGVAASRLEAYLLERQHVFRPSSVRPIWDRDTVAAIRAKKHRIAEFLRFRVDHAGAESLPPPGALGAERSTEASLHVPVRVNHWYREYEFHSTSAPYRIGNPPELPVPDNPYERGGFGPFDAQQVAIGTLHFVATDDDPGRFTATVPAAPLPPSHL